MLTKPVPVPWAGPGCGARDVCLQGRGTLSGHCPGACQDKGADLLGIEQQNINGAMSFWEHPAGTSLLSLALPCCPGNWLLRKPVLAPGPAGLPGGEKNAVIWWPSGP